IQTQVFYYERKTTSRLGSGICQKPKSDRDGTFEPQLIKKNQTHITGMDEQIIALYAKGLSNQEIVEMFKELYDADV
ncbi:transposase, partial [Glaesserella parasuis]|nr:transposase [Glaesserella parasuis]